MLAETNTYVFEADARVGKTEIRKAIVELYDVHPLKVNITNVPAKTIISKKGVKGVRPGKKKAIVYLKKGDKIDTL
ncbi:50S ribosomal protein L23 [Candidatus Nomurabacteria bacterium CG1_02_47_685]|nr:MAG: 50S ribosomal protein L23 [Candidatus Nomurabacteria bacterium CG1_02_47_685]